MKITYDPRADAIYIRLIDTETSDSDEIIPNITFDYTPDKKVRGIEILYASETLEGNPAQVDVELLTETLINKSEAA